LKAVDSKEILKGVQLERAEQLKQKEERDLQEKEGKWSKIPNLKLIKKKKKINLQQRSEGTMKCGYVTRR
jgi:hypothetical protein